jgi:DNA-binding NarL/FixJ family response regulator
LRHSILEAGWQTPPFDGVGPMTPRIRVMIADDNPDIRAAVAALLSDDDRLEIVGSAADVSELIASAKTACPDVIIIDLVMPGGGGVQAIDRLKEVCPRTLIVGFSGYADPASAAAMLAAGAHRYIVKGAGGLHLADEIVDVVRTYGD